MRQDRTTVFSGPMSEVLILQGLLESNGIPTFIPDENMKVIDPFATGANALTVHLQVPRDQALEAKRLLAWRPEPSERPVERAAESGAELERLGTRIRWASLMVWSVPYSLCLSWRYFRGVRRLGRKPASHFWTVASLAFGLLSLSGLLVVLVGAASHF
jgi:hypothetical protein